MALNGHATGSDEFLLLGQSGHDVDVPQFPEMT